MNKEYDNMSISSDLSQNTDLKVFQGKKNTSSFTNKQPSNSFIKKHSNEYKNDSSQSSTLKTEKDKKEKDNINFFLKEEKHLTQKILNQKLDSKLELQKIVLDDEEIESYSIKSDKVEDFPLSFRPTNRSIKESPNKEYPL